MAPHLTPTELDVMSVKAAKGQTPLQIHKWLQSQRNRKGLDTPNITNIRKALQCKTFRRGAVETRGRKVKLSKHMVKKINSTRKALIKNAAGESEVHWCDVLKKARCPKVHASTAARALKKEGIDIQWRTPRQRPQREKEHEAERKKICSDWGKLPKDFFTKKVDLIIDNKKFSVPTYARAVRHVKTSRVRGHLRTRQEGLTKGFTKPNVKRNRVNPGGSVNVCAGIIHGRIRLWHYLPAKWSGQVAADLYKGPIRKVLHANLGAKRKFLILEDNDPSGYKTKKGLEAKAEVKIEAVPYPRYSPDLNPLDFHVWEAVEKRMVASLHGPISIKAYKARLRRIAMALPKDEIYKAVSAMHRRAAAVVAAKGGDITCD